MVTAVITLPSYKERQAEGGFGGSSAELLPVAQRIWVVSLFKATGRKLEFTEEFL